MAYVLRPTLTCLSKCTSTNMEAAVLPLTAIISAASVPSISRQSHLSEAAKNAPKFSGNQSSAGFGRKERGSQNYYTKISVQLSVQHNKEPEHEARTLHPCLSKQSCSWLSPLSNWWGLRFPIPCYWDLQSHLAGARLVSYIRTYNRSQPPPQTQDYQLQLRLYLRPIHEIL